MKKAWTVLIVAASVACRQQEPAVQTSAPATTTVPTSIDVVKVIERPLEVDLSLPGELAPFQSVAVFARVAGFVKTVSVDRGSHVRAGDTLATLEAPELTAQRAEAQSKVQAAEAQLAAARARADGDRSTFEKLRAASATPGVVAGNDVIVAEKAADASRSQVSGAERSVEASRQALNAIQEMEAYLRVTAPFDGIVTERTVHPGALVGSGPTASPLFRVIDSRRLRLVVAVPEAYASSVTTGTVLPFGVAAYPAEKFSGTVARIAHAVDINTRTMAVELDVANGDGRLAPGAFCQVRWPVRRAGVSLFVPSGSVAATTGRTFVVRVRGGKTEWVDVRTGMTMGALVEVFGGLSAGDELASRGTDELRPGTEVRPRAPKPTS